MRTLLVVSLLGLTVSLNAQLYNAQWTLGFYESVLDFRNSDTVEAYTIPTLQYFTQTNASICDENGNLLYYTNGVNICGVNSLISNGMDLSNCSSSDSLNGINLPQAAIFLPQPGNSRYYYLFHYSNDALQATRPGNLFYSLIDKEGNQGQGAVVEKNINILSGHILRGGGMTACKHANGRDYWLIIGGSNNNGFYKFLITPNGVDGPFTQNIGPVFPLPYDIAYSKFSQDGSKYATGIYVGAEILVMDFDRCNGDFSSPIEIYNNASTDTLEPASGCASVDFSSNNRFLYATGNINLLQYDLWATNIQDSVVLYLEDSNTSYGINFLQTAPNGKIYGSTWDGGLYALHVINNPDLKGDSAGFVYGGQQCFTGSSNNLPNLINYKLGPLLGSSCDTITAISQPTVNNLQATVIPNPADKYAYVEMGMQGNYEFELINATGQIVDRKATPQIDIFDTEHLPAGTYFLTVKDKTTNTEIATKKVVVVH